MINAQIRRIDESWNASSCVAEKVFRIRFTFWLAQTCWQTLYSLSAQLDARGGRISVESEKGEGALFTLSFSLAPASTGESIGEPQPSPPASEPADYPQVPTLLVEDDPATQVFMRHLCGRTLDIHVAASADEARRVLEREPIQLILMDLSIPGPTDGLELTRALRAEPRWRAIPIIAVTAHASDSDRERSLAAGCDAYVSKPIDPDALLDTIGDVLRRRGRR